MIPKQSTPNHPYNKFIRKTDFKPNKTFDQSNKEQGEQFSSNIGFTYNVNDPISDNFLNTTIFGFNNSFDEDELRYMNTIYRKATSFREFHNCIKNRIVVKNKLSLETEYVTACILGAHVSQMVRYIKSQIFRVLIIDSYFCEIPEHSNGVQKVIDLRKRKGLLLSEIPPYTWNCNCCLKIDWDFVTV